MARNLLERAGVDGFRAVERRGDPARAAQRVLFVALNFVPTLQIGFVRPLQPLVESGQLAWELLADSQVTRIGTTLCGGRRRWVRRRLDAFQPDLIVFCRYSGPCATHIMDWAQENGAATVFHIDDDLLHVPPEIGAAKYRFHHRPARLRSIRHLLRTADLVYCSTPVLLERLKGEGAGDRGVAGKVHCPGEVLRLAPRGPEVTIGYMGYDHAHDFEVALPALVKVLERNPQVRFELFGSIPRPAALDRFGARVTQVPPVTDYQAFLEKFAGLGWAIGLCPLADTPFNRAKADNKWVEYTAVGAAVVASAGSIYDSCCAGGGGLLAGSEAAWEDALQSLVADESLRLALVEQAQARLAREYSMAALREQVQDIFRAARARAAHRGGAAGRAVEAW